MIMLPSKVGYIANKKDRYEHISTILAIVKDALLSMGLAALRLWIGKTERAELNSRSHGSPHAQRTVKNFSLPENRYPKDGPGSASLSFAPFIGISSGGKAAGYRSDCHDSDLNMAAKA
jgi:hypothetical protein